MNRGTRLELARVSTKSKRRAFNAAWSWLGMWRSTWNVEDAREWLRTNRPRHHAALVRHGIIPADDQHRKRAA